MRAYVEHTHPQRYAEKNTARQMEINFLIMEISSLKKQIDDLKR